MSKYGIDLDYTTPKFDISDQELKTIAAEADVIILRKNVCREELAIAHLKKAQCLQKLEQGAERSEDTQLLIKNLLEKALKLSPDMPEALMQMGKWSHVQCNFSEALNLYNRAIQLKPDYAAAYNNRGVTSVENGNYNGAIADFTEAIRLRPSEANYYFNRGLNYSKLGFHKEAIADFSESIRLRQGFKNAVFSRGLVYLSTGNKEKAKTDFDEVLRLGKIKNNFHSITI
jgi:tetratricopeptide (TPR) repeat protein